MLALEVRDCQSSSAWLCRVLDWVSEKIDAFVIGERIATSRYDDVANNVADLRGKSGKRRRVDPDVVAQAEHDIAEGMSRSLRDTSRQKQRFSLRTAGRRADMNLLACQSAARACFAGENRLSIAFDGTDLGGEGPLGTCIYSCRKRKFSWLIPKVGRFLRRGAQPPMDGAFSQSSASHHSDINQSSVSHQSVISQSSAGRELQQRLHEETEGPVAHTEGGALLCRWEGIRGARPPTDNTLSQSSANHHPGVNQTSVVHQSATSQPSAGRGAQPPTLRNKHSILQKTSTE